MLTLSAVSVVVIVLLVPFSFMNEFCLLHVKCTVLIWRHVLAF